MSKFIGISLAFFSLYLLVITLMNASNFFIPLLIALVIAYFIIALGQELEKIKILGKKLPSTFSLMAAIFVLLGAVYISLSIIGGSVANIVSSIPAYQEKLKILIQSVFDALGKPLPDFSKKIENFDFASLITGTALVLTDIASNAGMIAIYVLFLLAEYKYFDQKLMLCINTEKGKDSARKILTKVNAQVKSYVIIKTFLSATTATLSYLVLFTFGVDFAQFWAFLIFLLNFIPTIGSIVATVFPCMLALLQFGDLGTFLAVTISLTFVQVLIGNFLEPKIMGSRFNMSGLVIILSLTFWGHVWGITGMLLSVPLMMIISIILANFPQTKPIAIWISQTGSLDE